MKYLGSFIFLKRKIQNRAQQSTRKSKSTHTRHRKKREREKERNFKNENCIRSCKAKESWINMHKKTNVFGFVSQLLCASPKINTITSHRLISYDVQCICWLQA